VKVLSAVVCIQDSQLSLRCALNAPTDA